ncbi:Ent-kaurene synthase [Aspergillus piperis CBS 112811]|uniref:Ent-kaurene synthase n=1 Tax=Aspergillus piperis CBS 112811 TaxID=1448313 RepID=A0A8G1VJW7_9EURO|nr:Ent-kaurene synthase [Aspergillus piperis CBS 112811]RAH55100.1 Ent-kaurene synthase [Aspergillus piperis CBS 112811]
MAVRAERIIACLAKSLETPYQGSSSMTPSLYDTAWVSMVAKEGKWFFPECFQVVLESQSPGGGFGVDEGMSPAPPQQLDGILNTMAAVLALCRYQKNPSFSIQTGAPDHFAPLSWSNLQDRIDRARAYLDHALQCWDVSSTVQVGFEILVPSLLRLLHDEGLHFDFPGREALMVLHRRKMDKIQPALDLPCPPQTTLLHSLEGFIGSVELGKMAPCLTNGSMMGSPSSTAAYLIHSPNWDEEAENYLRHVVARNNGRVPSAFPISVFEISWVLSTLLSSGFEPDVLGFQNVSSLANYLETRLAEKNGVTGFAPGMLADADDTAKSIYSLDLLGRPIDCTPLLQAFECPTHFKTYSLETNESFSVNCNVMIALLACQVPSKHVAQISKALRFLCSAWDNGEWSDKWNTESQYTMMLMADALSSLIERWHDGALGDMDADYLAEHVPRVTLQILMRTLSAQSDESGSWKQSSEITAYGLLTLKSLASLPWVRTAIGIQVVYECIDRATEYLRAHNDRWDSPELIWVEKVNYGSSILSETYCLAALQRTVTDSTRWGKPTTGLCQVPRERIDRFCQFFARLPIFEGEPTWRLRASIVEGDLLFPALRRTALELAIFPFPTVNQTAKYLEYIPLTWTTSNSSAGKFGLSTARMIEMMVLSLLNFQVDKWFEETTEASRLQGDWTALRSVIRELFTEKIEEEKDHVKGRKREQVSPPPPQRPNCHPRHKRRQVKSLTGYGTSSIALQSNGHKRVTMDGDQDNIVTFLAEVKRTLTRFVQCVLQSPAVSSVPPALGRRVRQELCTFLLAHVKQGEDSGPQATRRTAMSQTYHEWVRTTSADHTSCPYSFEYFRCLVASDTGKDCFTGPLAQYLSQDVCRHLATMCRQYNDYGSMARDREEHNLNSIDFLMVGKEDEEKERHANTCTDKRLLLLEIAQYERECLELALKRLQPEVSKAAWNAWEVFLTVTDLYGQIYVARDINHK